MKYAVIVWATERDVLEEGKGFVYGWYEALATALNTATDLRRVYFSAVAVKML
jgi:hypothetical protein